MARKQLIVSLDSAEINAHIMSRLRYAAPNDVERYCQHALRATTVMQHSRGGAQQASIRRGAEVTLTVIAERRGRSPWRR